MWLLEHCRAHAGFAFRVGGERVLANVLRLTDLARQYEGAQATSFVPRLSWRGRRRGQGRIE